MRFVVVGGGVAGVCCVEELCRLRPDDNVTLVSADRVLKGVSVVARLSRTLEELALVERRLDELPYPNLRMVQDLAAGIDLEEKALLLEGGSRLPYDKLCICAGARPKQLPPGVFCSSASSIPAAAAGQQGGAGVKQPEGAELALPAELAEGAELAEMQRRVLTIRDTDSVQRLARQLQRARRVAVVGNGGIALELISGLKGADVTWIMKHAHIGDAYFDLDAAQFLLEELQHQRRATAAAAAAAGAQQQDDAQQPQQQEGGRQASVQQEGQPPPPPQPQQQQPGNGPPAAKHGGVLGHAVGPRWVQQLPAGAAATAGDGATEQLGSVELKYGCQIARIQLVPAEGLAAAGDGTSVAASLADRPLLLTLTDGSRVESDLVLLAIGVRPALEWVPPSVERAPDGGLRLNRNMQSSDPSIYAAGDSASCQWAADESRHWFQMRLWSQARAMGVYAAHCMAGVQDQTGADMAFELFTHVTRFLGKKVVLLGLYNGQRLDQEPAEDMRLYSRVTEGGGQLRGGCSCHPSPPPTQQPHLPLGSDRSFVRVLLLRGRVQGAVLIGDTDLDETLENLIMDQLDIGSLAPHLLDPDFELDHVFD